LVGERFVGEGAIHAHTQNLGVDSFQPFQILLDSFHLLGSTTGEGENKKRHDNVLLAAILAQGDTFQIVAVKIFHGEIGRDIAHLRHGYGRLLRSGRVRCGQGKRARKQ
jgi:hypothetical protein